MSTKIDKTLILKQIQDYYGLKKDADFARMLDIKPQTLSSWYSRNTFDADLLFAKCVEIDGNFILSGKEPIERPCTKNKEITNKKNDSVNVSENTEKQKIKKSLTNTHDKSVAEPNENYKNKQRTLIPGYGKGIKLIPIEAMAGYGAGEIQVMEYEAGDYIVPEFEELNVDYMIRVKGSSMYPKYNSGDLIACKKLFLSDLFFQWNKVYVLSTEQGALVKRIHKGSDKEHILLVSDNPKYEPFEIHLSKVYAVALVVGVIRLE